MTTPPKTQRFCRSCEKVTTFRYDPIIGHSCCSICGFRFGIRLDSISLPLVTLIEDLKKNKGDIVDYKKALKLYLETRKIQLSGCSGDAIGRIREIKEIIDILELDLFKLNDKTKKMQEHGAKI